MATATAATGSKKKRRYRLPGARTLVTREIAALDFLQKIPMAREEEILSRAGRSNTPDDDEVDAFREHSDDEGEDARVHPDPRAPRVWAAILPAIGRSLGAFFLGDVSRWPGGDGTGGRRGFFSAGLGGWRSVPRTGEENSAEGATCAMPGSTQAQPLENPLDNPGSRYGSDEQRSTVLRGDHALDGTPRDAFGAAIVRAALTAQPQVIGRRLAGPVTPDVGIPSEIRYRLSREGNAKVRQWEQDTVHLQGMERSRLFMSCSRGYPLAVAEESS